MVDSTDVHHASRPTRVVLGITGGIAAYKAAELTRLFVKAGIAVDVVMTEAATHFVTATTFQALSGRPVLTDLWESGADNAMGHIDVSRGADAIVVAPASADFLAKLAHGHADDLLSTLCLARECPLLVAPAMNRQMWANAATQRNIAQLRADGVGILGPDTGELACMEHGEGRMLEAEALFAAVVAAEPAQDARRQARPDDGRPDLRGHRSRARHHEFELGQDGIRSCTGGRGGRCDGSRRRAARRTFLRRGASRA